MATDFEAAVRARIRHLRFERGLALADVAAAAGLATSTLSRLESGARGVKLAHLPRLAAALGVEVGSLVGDASAPEPAPARDGKVWSPLVDERPDGVRAYKIRLPATLREPALGSHEGHALLVVLAGRLRLVIGEHAAVLEPGEAAEFSTWEPHWVGVVEEPVDVLAVFSPTGRPIRWHATPKS